MQGRPGPTEGSYLLMDAKRFRRRNGGGEHMANQPEESKRVENTTLHNLNHCAIAALFAKGMLGAAGVVLLRFWLALAFGYQGHSEVASVTAFMAGTYFVLSMILKGILDEYAESSRLPLQISSEIILYRELLQLTAQESELERATCILDSIIENVVHGIAEPVHGITTIEKVIQDLSGLHSLHMDMVVNEWVEYSMLAELTKQATTLRTLILRADHIARSPYLPISTAFCTLLSICATLVLLTVKCDSLIQELTLLPFLALFVYLLALFAADLDDPFDLGSSVSVSMEALTRLQDTCTRWAAEDSDKKKKKPYIPTKKKAYISTLIE